MNRIILIGNGFDVAHGLETKYSQFMEAYWTNILNNISSQGILKLPYQDEFEFVQLKLYEKEEEISTETLRLFSFTRDPQKDIYSYNDVKESVKSWNTKESISNIECKIIFKNKFFEHLSEKTCLTSWLDIENEYYAILKDFLKKPEDRLYKGKWASVKDLNDEFGQVKNALEQYLTKACKQGVEQKESIQKILSSAISYRDVSYSKSKDDLGNIDDYELFLDKTCSVYEKLYKFMRSGAYIVVIVKNVKKGFEEIVIHCWGI